MPVDGPLKKQSSINPPPPQCRYAAGWAGGAANTATPVRGVGFGWVGLAASCKSRPSGVGFLPCPTTRLNNLIVRFQGQADYGPTEAHVGGRYRCPSCGHTRREWCWSGSGARGPWVAVSGPHSAHDGSHGRAAPGPHAGAQRCRPFQSTHTCAPPTG